MTDKTQTKTTGWARMNPIEHIASWYERTRMLEVCRLRQQAVGMAAEIDRLRIELRAAEMFGAGGWFGREVNEKCRPWYRSQARKDLGL